MITTQFVSKYHKIQSAIIFTKPLTGNEMLNKPRLCNTQMLL